MQIEKSSVLSHHIMFSLDTHLSSQLVLDETYLDHSPKHHLEIYEVRNVQNECTQFSCHQWVWWYCSPYSVIGLESIGHKLIKSLRERGNLRWAVSLTNRRQGLISHTCLWDGGFQRYHKSFKIGQKRF